jgi:hypothetical protein
MTWKFLWTILLTELQRDSNWDLHTVMCPLHRQNCRRNHRRIYLIGDSIGKH